MEILVRCISHLVPSKRQLGIVFLCPRCLKDRKLKLLEDYGFSYLLLESELTEEIMVDV